MEKSWSSIPCRLPWNLYQGQGCQSVHGSTVGAMQKGQGLKDGFEEVEVFVSVSGLDFVE